MIVGHLSAGIQPLSYSYRMLVLIDQMLYSMIDKQSIHDRQCSPRRISNRCKTIQKSIESGFYYLQNRYYDPNIGRFINADGEIIGTLECGANLFSYCNNNPVLLVDKTGFRPDICGNTTIETPEERHASFRCADSDRPRRKCECASPLGIHAKYTDVQRHSVDFISSRSARSDRKRVTILPNPSICTSLVRWPQ